MPFLSFRTQMTSRPSASLLRGIASSLLVLGCALAVGCSVRKSGSYSDDGTGNVSNVCFESCSIGICVDGICEARASDLKTLLVEVSLPAGTLLPGASFTQTLEITDAATNIRLENLTQLTGSLKGAPVPVEACVPLTSDETRSEDPDGSFPAKVTLSPRTRLLGLPSPTTTAVSTLDGVEHVISLLVPPGQYDIFVEPSGSDSNCYRPPYLIVNQEVAPGDLELRLTLPEPIPLDVTVEVEEGERDLSKFELAIVEGATGRVISNEVKLGKGTTSEGVTVYRKNLVYSTVQGELSNKVPELLRITPPEGVLAPTVFVDRGVAGLLKPNQAVVSQLLGIPDGITVRGALASESTASKRAKLTFIATNFDFVAPGTPFAFVRETKSDEAGNYSIELLPGEYRILIEPESESFSVSETNGVFGRSANNIKLDLTPPMILEGAISTPFGEPFPFLDYELVSVDSFLDFKGTPELFARVVEGATNGSGMLLQAMDVGVYEMTFRPAEDSGFPWMVLPTVTAKQNASSQVNAQVSLPLSLRGKISAADIGGAPAAIVRFYALLEGEELTADLAKATRAVAIGEARADEKGEYSVLLPSRVGSPVVAR